jgi:hypothetical protein
VILARIPLLSRSVRHWRIGCRGYKVNHPQLQQDVDSAYSGAKPPDLPTLSDEIEPQKASAIQTRVLTSLFNILITY